MSAISFSQLQRALTGRESPILIDVRRRQTFQSAADMIGGALRRDPETVGLWAKTLPRASGVIAYCVHGGEVSQAVGKALGELGFAAGYLEGGIEDGWKPNGGALDPKPAGADTRWVTREQPKIDRIACPWLIARFVDPNAEFLYVPTKQVREVAAARNAVPYDIPDVHFTHDGNLCSFDAFMKHYRLYDPALERLAVIVRGADTARLDLAAQAAGLAAVSLGLSRIFPDDQEMLKHGMVVYDALYSWCKDGQDELHTWNPEAYR